jgi:DNA-binding CsgD family transcriptional regulator
MYHPNLSLETPCKKTRARAVSKTATLAKRKEIYNRTSQQEQTKSKFIRVMNIAIKTVRHQGPGLHTKQFKKADTNNFSLTVKTKAG